MRNLNPSTAQSIQNLRNGSYSGAVAQGKDHTLYDTIPFVAAASLSGPIAFFTVPFGSAQYGLTKTEVETNMQEQGKLPAGQSFEIQTFSFSHIRNTDTGEFESAKTAAFSRVLMGSRFRIVLPGRQFDAEFPGAKLLPPSFTRQDNVAAQATAVSSVGDFIGPNQMVFKTPLSLTNVQGSPVNFRVEMLVNTSDAAVSAALTTLATAGTNGADRIQIRLGGFLLNQL